MKPFWTDMLYDLENNGKEWVAENWGQTINRDLDAIKGAIKSYDLIKALALIEDSKGYY